MKRTVLGKGISAIISNEPVYQNQLIEIDIDKIYPNPNQPRKSFSHDKILELAESMKQSGMIQPIVVFKQDSKYYLIVGERRWRAAQILQWQKIPALVRDLSQDEVIVDSLVENIQRENLNALEIANAIENLGKMLSLTHQQISERIGMSRTAVTNFFRLLKLPMAVKEWILQGKLDQGHARALLSLENEDQIISAADKIVKKQMSVRETEKLVKKLSSKSLSVEKSKTFDPNVEKMESKLTKLFSTQVKINYSPSGHGNLNIYFDSLDEFQRILSIISKE